MPTVNRDIADDIAKNDGWYRGDRDNSLGDNPRCVEITEYVNAWGGTSYGLTFAGQVNVYMPSEFVIEPKRYWKAG